MISIRLNKHLSEIGFCSRRKADELIAKGFVFVARTKAIPGQKITEDDFSNITVCGKNVGALKASRYFALYKPRGIISSLSNSQGCGLSKYIPKDTRLFPVGRLDKESEGLIILTNDGNLSQRLTHPKYSNEKKYHLEFSSKNSKLGKAGIIKQFQSGIYHNKILYRVDSARFINKNVLEITLHEGKSRHIRIISGKIGLTVSSLKRVSIGKLSLGQLNLKIGKLREIDIKDIER